ncbi:threonine-phosphate decarboxylase CobD [Fusibacter sp. JL216-2]|uniref:threonine-phosphate decarboxylase CobD n=1 Tax=Fusibacter sp. JL216-2 TaxID=3071453 RepID=UPI003D34EBF6
MKKEHGGNVYKVSRETGMDIKDIIDFSANINPLGIPASGKKAIEESIEGLVNYPDPDYIDFRKAIGRLHDLDYASVVPGNGAIDSLFAAVEAVQPKKVLVSVPSFVEYEKAVEKSGAEYVPSYRLEDEAYTFNVDRFINDMKTDIDLGVICNPNNPTGDIIGPEDIEKILKHCQSIGAYLLVDEAFMEFAERLGQETCIGLTEKYKGLIVSRSLTKYYAVPGLRCGYLITKDVNILEKLLSKAQPWKLNHLADRFSQSVVFDEAYNSQTGAWFREENSSLKKALDSIPGLKVNDSYANYLFFKYEGGADMAKSLLERGIMIRTCHNYDGMGENYFRVAIKDKASNEKLIMALKQICE